MSIKEQVKSIVSIGETLSDKISLIHEPQRNYMFDFAVFETSDSGLFSSEMKTYVKSLEVPSQSRDPIIVDYMDTKIVFAGKDSGSHSFTVTLWDDESMTVHDYMHKWFQLTGDHKYGQGANKKDYVKNVDINYRDVSDIVSTGTINIRNVFPTEIGAISMSYEDSSILEMQVTFSFDHIEFGDFLENISGTLSNIKAGMF